MDKFVDAGNRWGMYLIFSLAKRKMLLGDFLFNDTEQLPCCICKEIMFELAARSTPIADV